MLYSLLVVPELKQDRGLRNLKQPQLLNFTSGTFLTNYKELCPPKNDNTFNISTKLSKKDGDSNLYYFSSMCYVFKN